LARIIAGEQMDQGLVNELKHQREAKFAVMFGVDPNNLAQAGWGVIMAISPLLQIRRMIQRRSSSDLSLSYLAVLLIGFTLWMAYGISLGNLALIIPNGVALRSAWQPWYRHQFSNRWSQAVARQPSDAEPNGQRNRTSMDPTARWRTMTDEDRWISRVGSMNRRWPSEQLSEVSRPPAMSPPCSWRCKPGCVTGRDHCQDPIPEAGGEAFDLAKDRSVMSAVEPFGTWQ
jgi:uncharacterized protein with PQ loop repeat